jgi:hypothetical protein
MPTGPDDLPERGATDGLGALARPAEHDLEYHGPGDGTDRDERLLPDPYLPGGVDHTTAAVGAGSAGLILLGVAGVFKRRWGRRRYETLDE